MVNLAVVIGKLSKAPEGRSLPSGLSLANFDLSVPRGDEPADSVPVALFTGEDGLPSWEEGAELLVIGRVRRRFFRVNGSTQSRTEVVAERVVPLAQAGAATQALEQAKGILTSATPAGLGGARSRRREGPRG